MSPNAKKDDKYTDPELRDEVKEEIQAGDKGGAPGQWSARKVLESRATRFEALQPRRDMFGAWFADSQIGADDGFGVQEAWRRLYDR